MSAAAGWAARLEATPVAALMREATWLYPGIEIVHLVGLILVVGTAFVFDLRLLGWSPGLALAPLSRHLVIWAFAGMAIVVPSGFLLFAAHATDLAANPVFYVKLALIATAGVNAGTFHLHMRRTAGAFEHDAPPLLARANAMFSLVLWTGVVACGRLLAYW